MTLSIQFHAMPDEHGVLLSGALDDSNLWVSEHRIDSPAFKLVERAGETPAQPGVRALIFGAMEPDLDAVTMHQFAGLNPDALVLEIGALSESGLAESWLWSNARDKELVRRWRKAANQLKASLLSGAIAINPATGESAPMKWHRFTRKAQKAYANGVVMRPAAGTSIIKLPSI